MSVTNRVSLASEKSAASVDSRPSHAKNQDPELIPTAFGDLTRGEIREWERMLGRRLLRLPSHPTEIKSH
ncbi:MAG TPA: hypothetical protein VGD60_11405 [Candidatus Acidoferrales bacterium]